MTKRSIGTAISILLAVTGSAFADDFFHFDDPGNVQWNGVLVNPYTATDLTKNKSLTIYCDDWNSDFSGNPYWYASVTSLTDVEANQALLGNLKYGLTTPNWNVNLNGSGPGATLSKVGPSSTPTALNRYLEAAWLDAQWESHTYGTSQTTQTELAAAVWLLFVNDAHVDGLITAINNSGYADRISYYLTQAEGAVPGWDATGWSVITPDANYLSGAAGPTGSGLHQTINGSDMQEFLVHTPEPGAVILLSTVVAVLGLTKFRRKLQS